jgi:stage II sporulation protein AA (anti-sigma F factor antagonist)
MNIRISNEGEQMVVFLKGELDHHTVSQIRMQIDASIENTRPSLLIFDFSDVGFMDSSGIGLILGRARLMNSYGGKVGVQNPNETIERVIRVCGLGQLIL